MKLLAFVFSLFFIFYCSPGKTSAASAKTYYAKILSDNVYLYSSASDDENCRLFVVPNSYFVLLIGESGNYYHAKYSGIVGYVKKSDVTPMDGVPVCPFASQSFRAFAQNGLDVYASPHASASTLGKLSFLQDNVALYGTASGDELFPKSTTTWFYCSFNSGGNAINGYVFSYFCDNLSLASENLEYFSEISTPLSFDDGLPSDGGLSDTATAMIVLGVSLPCLVILYLILTPKKRGALAKSHRKEKSPPQKRGRDYYEFNEDDLN